MTRCQLPQGGASQRSESSAPTCSILSHAPDNARCGAGGDTGSQRALSTASGSANRYSHPGKQSGGTCEMKRARCNDSAGPALAPHQRNSPAGHAGTDAGCSSQDLAGLPSCQREMEEVNKAGPTARGGWMQPLA